MHGAGGRDVLEATSEAAGFGLDLRLAPAAGAEALLHDGDGWIDFAIAGGSYYYSRPRLTATGTLTLEGRSLPVEGTAWFDHQWGDFIAVGAGGWDWFAVNLDDGTDLVVSRIRDANGDYPFAYGEIRGPDGRQRHLSAADIEATVAGRWTSPSTGATYPAGWQLEIPSEGLVVDLSPTIAGQELDTRPTTGVVYWEGSQVVRATRAGTPLGGEAYVELTGYGPAGLAGP
jgi:predicted secreted hydrolase